MTARCVRFHATQQAAASHFAGMASAGRAGYDQRSQARGCGAGWMSAKAHYVRIMPPSRTPLRTRTPNIVARRLYLFDSIEPGPDIAPLVAGGIEQFQQRRRATRELNEGETENALKQAIFFHRIGRIRDHMLRAQCIAQARSIWSRVPSSRETLSTSRRPDAPPGSLQDLLQHFSPLEWQHINLTGDLSLDRSEYPINSTQNAPRTRAVARPEKYLCPEPNIIF